MLRIYSGVKRGRRYGSPEWVKRLRARKDGIWKTYPSTQQNVTGFSAITTQVINYCVVGRICFIDIEIIGTSNATTFTIDLPIPVASAGFFGIPGNSSFINGYISAGGQAVDNSSAQANASVAYFTSGTSRKTITFLKDQNGTSWTNSGTKAWRGSFFYPVSGRSDSKQWNFSNNFSVTGFSSFDIKQLYWMKMQNTIFGIVLIEGTSNSTTFTFNLPVIPRSCMFSNVSSANSLFINTPMIVKNNTALSTNAGSLQINTNTRSATVRLTMENAAFTNSGKKGVRGCFFYDC